MDPQHPGTVMVSTLDRWWPGDDVFRSTDDGKTWRSLAKNAPHDYALAPWLLFHQKAMPNGPMGHWMNSVEIDPPTRTIACTPPAGGCGKPTI